MKIDSIKYVGISLSGGKSDRTYIARLDEYRGEKLVLSSLKQAGKGSLKKSSDRILIDEVSKIRHLKAVGVDAPLQLPTCIRCRLRCPGYEVCKVAAVKTMRKLFETSSKKRKKVYSPYTERLAEHLINELEGADYFSGAMGANHAPLTARALFLQKHFKAKLFEVYPKLAYYRLAKSFGLPKKYLHAKRLSQEGDEARLRFLKHLSDQEGLFMYIQDVQHMVDNPFAFDAFLVSLSLYLNNKKLTEKRPRNLPKSELWPLFPKSNLKFPSI
tara:strand:- start:1183 stop:1998 length:816 start_codon:yes stop_codon:yes gene_type:complete